MIEKVISFLNRLPHDKALHGFYLLTFFGILTAMSKGILFSALLSSIVMVGKELYDSLHRDIHTPDGWDIAVPFIPIWVMVVIAYVNGVPIDFR